MLRMQNFFYLPLFIITLYLSSCSTNEVKDGIKKGINKSGDVTGQVIGEFSSGVSSGVEKTFEPNLELSQALQAKGLKFGKKIISSDSLGSDNLLVVYVIFNNEFKGTLVAKAFDVKGQEMGRVKLAVEGKADDARFLEFHFDKRTNIDSDSKLVIE
ncbi:hypothetical protein Fluta_0810 [Sporocytophaga myxococcoides]|uniref:Uncharacterized protein n=2 Tax=Sporocytophaga myxococcoides TaxID=153721 RepID=A0A098LCJ1_9BACT|nr:hypothetical protein Fluta_0810 [Sporocytophaga myxococcoides]